MFGLLAHYSKENAALYKAQKQQRKSNQAPQVNEKKSKKNHGKEMQPNGFVIPGQGQQIPQDINQNQNMQQVQVRENPVVINQQHKLEDNNLKVNKQIQQVQQVRQIQQPPYNAGAIGETTVLNTNPTGQTTVLGVDAMMPVMPYLVRKRNNERIDINKPVFRIGKEKSYVDYFIADNSAISRSHANIVTRENEYFLVDTNSTNHSYIDGKMIPSNQEVQIASGSVIKLANEEFEFHL
jgi:hypothetical protein